ncbi:hypothetical protein H072_9071 [Dactylellina haptotyla CBS 200.50]|uniref:F-box domain-containing protein n=1 Tax=Dactylellina haptotyla (strain CBS 200.50) TaxID=1284197 RepID=S8A3K4_DACHA|nr:hypothetical protein H072_9071 [Dactylellina haptotyla CBS 200.50]
MLTKLHDELLLEVMENLDANGLFAFVQVFQRARNIFIAYCDQLILKATRSPQNTLSPNFAKYFPSSPTNIHYQLDPTIGTITSGGHSIGRHFKMLLHLVRFASTSNAIKMILDSLFPDEKRLAYIQDQNQNSGWDYLSSMSITRSYVYCILIKMGQRNVYFRDRDLKIGTYNRLTLYHLTFVEGAPLPPTTIEIPKNVDSIALISLYDNFTGEVPRVMDS